MGYGPKLTDKQKAQLEKEIREFDKKKILRDIEKNAVGGPDLQAYQDLVQFGPEVTNSENKINEYAAANPDRFPELAEKESDPMMIDFEMLNAKMEINEILSHRQKQVWQLCMRQGKTLEQASEQLNLKIGTVSDYLKTAKEKVKRHFNA